MAVRLLKMCGTICSVVWKDPGKALKFSCEFMVGEGKDPRPAGTPRFKIEVEKSSGKENGNVNGKEEEGTPAS